MPQTVPRYSTCHVSSPLRHRKRFRVNKNESDNVFNTPKKSLVSLNVITTCCLKCRILKVNTVVPNA